ncbi:exosortase-dependent surface protein XDP1 [Methylomonas sp. MgM2]
MTRLHFLLLAVALTPIQANATLSWTFSGSGGVFTTKTFTGSDNKTVTVNAYSTTNDVPPDPNNYYDPNNTLGDKFETAKFGVWNGIGVYDKDGSYDTTDSPHHAFDNDGGTNNAPDEFPDGDVDAAVFKFDQDTTLTSISIGWKYSDADLSVLAYTGNDDPLASITDYTFSDLLTHGWTLVGNYANLVTSGARAINSAQISSSYWLISAYTSCANGTESNSTKCIEDASNSGLDFGNDYFKISGLTGEIGQPPQGNTGSVPEPSSLWLLAGGLMGWRLNRRKGFLA